MPMPKPSDPANKKSGGKPLTVKGKPVTKLVHQVKPWKKAIPDIALRLTEMADRAKRGDPLTFDVEDSDIKPVEGKKPKKNK